MELEKLQTARPRGMEAGYTYLGAKVVGAVPAQVQR